MGEREGERDWKREGLERKERCAQAESEGEGNCVDEQERGEEERGREREMCVGEEWERI